MYACMRLASLIIVGSLLFTPPLDAQEDERPRGLTEGNHALSFRLPESGTATIGFSRMLSDRTSLGLDLALGIQRLDVQEGGEDRRDARNTSVAVRPLIRRYFAPRASVAPFFWAGVSVVYREQESTDVATSALVSGETLHVGVVVGGGAEWFFASMASLGGRVGLQAGFARAEDQGGLNTIERGHFLETFTSNIGLNIYF